MATSLCHVSKLKASSIRSCKHWSICTSTEFSTAIWSRKTCWLTQAVRTSSLLTLDWHERSACPLRRTLTKWSLSGIGAPKFSSARKHILLELIYGQLGASSQKWCNVGLFSWVTPKLTKSSKFSRSLVHQMRTTGPMLSNLVTSNRPSPSSAACPWSSTHPHSTSWRWTCWQDWLRWIPTDAYQHWLPSSTLTLMIWTEPASIIANNSSERLFASILHWRLLFDLLHVNY